MEHTCSSKIFWCRKLSCIGKPRRRVGDITVLSKNSLCLITPRKLVSELWITVPKNFARKPFCVSKKYVVPNCFLQSRRASRFCQSLLSHSAKKLRGETFNVSEDLGHRLFLCINGQLHDFISKNSNSQCRNISNRSRPRIQKNPGIEKFYA